MSFSRLSALIAISCWASCPAPGVAQDADPLIEQHAWAKFPVNSWKLVRVVSETLDDRGQVANVTTTETKTTLVSADTEGYGLRIESTVEVAGKRFASQPQVVKHGYNGENGGPRASIKKLNAAEISIDGRAIKCELRQINVEADGLKLVTTIHYAEQVPPYQLRRETAIEGASADQQSSSVAEVIALDLPHRIIDDIRSTAVVKTTRRQAQGTKVTLEMHADDVPGGVVSHAASETDASGRVLRRSTLQLLDYAIGGQETHADPAMRRRFFHRSRSRRKG